MSRKFTDISGQKFGRLVALYPTTPTKNGNMKWLCRCECGNEIIVDNQSLKKGATKSCGCLAKEICILTHTKHKMYKTKLNSVWNSMKQRCSNPNHIQYHNYGGRGIKVCPEWNDKINGFMNFYNWAMQNGYNKNAKFQQCTLDRINNNGNYEPNNCRWVTIEEQCNNRRTNHYITYNQETHTIAEWSKILNINRYTLYDRINKSNMSIEKALTKKVNHKNKEIKNESNN